MFVSSVGAAAAVVAAGAGAGACFCGMWWGAPRRCARTALESMGSFLNGESGAAMSATSSSYSCVGVRASPGGAARLTSTRILPRCSPAISTHSTGMLSSAASAPRTWCAGVSNVSV